jgi:hypothetical protein
VRSLVPQWFAGGKPRLLAKTMKPPDVESLYMMKRLRRFARRAARYEMLRSVMDERP